MRVSRHGMLFPDINIIIRFFFFGLVKTYYENNKKKKNNLQLSLLVMGQQI